MTSRAKKERKGRNDYLVVRCYRAEFVFQFMSEALAIFLTLIGEKSSKLKM